MATFYEEQKVCFNGRWDKILTSYTGKDYVI